ncbi:Lrp/AsnC ligand binding domain-containing protein [archaeon]|nr:Lrp/AsnC ligand binding domain-containing protein [archaeon]
MSTAYVLMNCDIGSEKNVISSLGRIDGIVESHGTLGLYDIMAKVESENEKGIQSIVTETIRKMPKIHSTMTLTRSESEELFHPSEKTATSTPIKNSSQAYVVIHTKKGQEYCVLRSLSGIPEIREADVVFGLYDVLCKIETSGYQRLEEIITKEIRKLSYIQTSMTLNVIAEQE